MLSGSFREGTAGAQSSTYYFAPFLPQACHQLPSAKCPFVRELFMTLKSKSGPLPLILSHTLCLFNPWHLLLLICVTTWLASDFHTSL